MLDGIRLAIGMGCRGLGFGFGFRLGGGGLLFSSMGPRRASVRVRCCGLVFGMGGGVRGACGATGFGGMRRWPTMGLRAIRVN